KVLREFIPRIARAKDKDAYELEIIQLIARITDTHANLNVPPQVLPPAGTCQLPVVTRFVENRPIVTDYSEAKAGAESGLKIGDVIEAIGGEPVQQLIARWMPYHTGSNEAARLQNIARSFTRGPCSPVEVRVRRENAPATL